MGPLLFVSHDRYFIQPGGYTLDPLSRDYDVPGEKAELEALAAAQAKAMPVFFYGGSRSNDYHLRSKAEGTPRKITVALSNWKRRWKSWIKIQDITETMHGTNVTQLTWFNSKRAGSTDYPAGSGHGRVGRTVEQVE